MGSLSWHEIHQTFNARRGPSPRFLLDVHNNIVGSLETCRKILELRSIQIFQETKVTEARSYEEAQREALPRTNNPYNLQNSTMGRLHLRDPQPQEDRIPNVSLSSFSMPVPVLLDGVGFGPVKLKPCFLLS